MLRPKPEVRPLRELAGQIAKWLRTLANVRSFLDFGNWPARSRSGHDVPAKTRCAHSRMPGRRRICNSGNASGNEAPVMAVEPSENPEGLAGNNYAIIFCVVCGKECSAAHSCGSCGKDVHAICGINYGGEITCRLCHNKQVIRKKRSGAHASLQAQGAKMLRSSGAKFPPAKVGDNVRIRIPDVDRGRGDPRSVLAVVMNVEDGFYKLGTEHGVLKHLYSRSEFSILHEKLLTLDSIGTEEKSLRTIASSQSLTGGQGYTRCNCSTKCATNRCKCRSNKLLCNSKCHKSSACCNK